MFKDFSKGELKYYFGFGFLFFILDTFLYLKIFFGFIYNTDIPLYWPLIIHDILYILFYFLLILFLAFFFRFNIKRAMLFVLPQFYLYEYLGGFFVEGVNHFVLTPKTLLVRLIILASGAVVIYFPLRYFRI